jgi:hypothetical protein
MCFLGYHQGGATDIFRSKNANSRQRVFAIWSPSQSSWKVIVLVQVLHSEASMTCLW